VPASLSHSAQDYLKAIHSLERAADGRVGTSAVAERMGVSAPSATAMLKRLAALGLVRHERYRGVSLTERGERVAVEIVRHHRLLEQYLSETLGISIEAVHAEADRLEHALSEELEARIDERLGFPTHDPHGDPIPDADLNLAPSDLRPLADLVAGEEATVRRVPDEDPQLLRYLASLHLVPGVVVRLCSAAPFGGPLVVAAEGAEHAISRELAAAIGVA
jgi:DtxR family Mn-dependent transcriptional regulator